MEKEARALAVYVENCPEFPPVGFVRCGYQHMGATICDTILQAGLNYRTVVAPRVTQLRSRWPSARTSSNFLRNVKRYGVESVLSWKDAEKPRRIRGLAEFLVARRLESEADVAKWLETPGSKSELSALRGFGPKTVDYLGMLVGWSKIPIDRHVRTFVGRVGFNSSSYAEIQTLMHRTAEILSVDAASFDHAVWKFESARSRVAA